MAVIHVDTEDVEKTYMLIEEKGLTPEEARIAKELFHGMIAKHLLG